MPQFLTTSGTAYSIEDIIIRAKNELVLITPYLKLSRILSERLLEADQRGVSIKLVYGKSELRPEERHRLDTLPHLELLYLENLHAKCYFNDSSLIISSMNLYEFSEKNNREMGVMLTRRDDDDCFKDALAEAHSIIAAARATQVLPSQSANKPLPQVTTPVVPTSRQFDHALKMGYVQELLAQTFARVKFEFQDNTIIAKSFPRPGLHFSYDGSIRIDFSSSKIYESTKKLKRAEFDYLLGAYRCYWNSDVIQIYSAKSYNQQEEKATAQYHVEAVKKANDMLQHRLF